MFNLVALVDVSAVGEKICKISTSWGKTCPLPLRLGLNPWQIGPELQWEASEGSCSGWSVHLLLGGRVTRWKNAAGSAEFSVCGWGHG